MICFLHIVCCLQEGKVHAYSGWLFISQAMPPKEQAAKVASEEEVEQHLFSRAAVIGPVAAMVVVSLESCSGC